MKSSLSADEVCKILDKCRDLPLVEIRFSNLHLKFRDAKQKTHAMLEPFLEENATLTNLAKKIETQAIDDDEQVLKQRQLDEALITDPVLYEELATHGDLVKQQSEE